MDQSTWAASVWVLFCFCMLSWILAPELSSLLVAVEFWDGTEFVSRPLPPLLPRLAFFGVCLHEVWIRERQLVLFCTVTFSRCPLTRPQFSHRPGSGPWGRVKEYCPNNNKNSLIVLSFCFFFFEERKKEKNTEGMLRTWLFWRSDHRSLTKLLLLNYCLFLLWP